MPVVSEGAGLGLYGLLRPFLFRCAPETAHGLAIRGLQIWQNCPGGRAARPADPGLRQRLWGLDFPNPVGLAAGFDKNGQVWRGVLRLGFGFAEIGSVTPLAQAGNPQPRLFRLTAAEAVLNRMGFNNAGIAAMERRLTADGRANAARQGILGINLGKNKTTEDAAADYERGIGALARFADYLVINVSSPNTPGLRALQGREPLQALVARARRALDAAPLDAVSGRGRPPLLLKIAPDLTPEDLADIAAVALDGGLDGLIVSNTTITRPDVDATWQQEAGGLSGRPLFSLSTRILGDIYRLTGGKLPLIGVGGISSAADAYAKIRAGASLVQLYSGLIYRGPSLARRINRDLPALLQRDGFDTIAAAVGVDHR
ncbi:MAG TPA: quinone-dependent dihydroorotate dehydrogenase [Dongiaceae bacterium]|nr:quinone-dependent dihydroorotate dehydrogenase [Dongiaceae bacterium]